jgi:hypothetical protein
MSEGEGREKGGGTVGVHHYIVHANEKRNGSSANEKERVLPTKNERQQLRQPCTPSILHTNSTDSGAVTQ